MTFVLDPGPYRFDLKRGMAGTDVAAWQINLRIAVDGFFGGETEDATREFQRKVGLDDDGIAGGFSQARMIRRRSREPEHAFNLPDKFLYSKAAKEAGLRIAAWAPHPSDPGYDLGAFQLNFGPDGRQATQAAIASAYDVRKTAATVARDAGEDHHRFLSGEWVERESWYGEELNPAEEYSPEIFAWQLVALAHNWPAAAEHLATIGRIYIEKGRDDQPEQWIEQATGFRLSTPREWVLDYIPGATVYVRW